MPDILDAAQQKINDAAQPAAPATDAPASPPAPPVPPSPPSPPSPADSSTVASAKVEALAKEGPTEAESKLVDTLIQAAEQKPPQSTPAEPAPATEPVVANFSSRSEEQKPPEPKPPSPPPSLKKKAPGRGFIIAVFFLLFATVPLGVYFVSQQNQLADVRSRAVGNENESWESLDPETQKIFEDTWGENAKDQWQNEHAYYWSQPKEERDAMDKDPKRYQEKVREAKLYDKFENVAEKKRKEQQKTGGIVNPGTDDDSCNNTTGECEAGEGTILLMHDCASLEDYPDQNLSSVCIEENPQEMSGKVSCLDEANNSCRVIQLDVVPPEDKNDIIDTIVCTPDKSKCGDIAATSGTSGGVTEQKKEKVKKRKKRAAVCQKLKVYKGGKKFTALSTLKAGDAITFAVDGKNDKKARIRVNGAAWTETETKNSKGEFTLDFTVPDGTTAFTVEAEVYDAKKNKWK